MSKDRLNLVTEGYEVRYTTPKVFFNHLGFLEFPSTSKNGSIGQILLPIGWKAERKFESHEDTVYFMYDAIGNLRGKATFVKHYITNKLYKKIVRMELYTRFFIRKVNDSLLVLEDHDCSHSRMYRLKLPGYSEDQSNRRLIEETNNLLRVLPMADDPSAYWGIPITLWQFLKTSTSHWI